MPTILFINGWRVFFYANENNEPIHVHAQKGDMDCKYWLLSKSFAVEEAYSYNMNSKNKREIKKIIFEHFELIEQAWNEFQQRKGQ